MHRQVNYGTKTICISGYDPDSKTFKNTSYEDLIKEASATMEEIQGNGGIINNVRIAWCPNSPDATYISMEIKQHDM